MARVVASVKETVVTNACVIGRIRWVGCCWAVLLVIIHGSVDMGRCWGSKVSPTPSPRTTAAQPLTDLLTAAVTVAGTTAVEFMSVPLEASKAYNIDLRCFVDDLISQIGTKIEIEFTGTATTYITGESEEAYDFYTVEGGVATAVDALYEDGIVESQVLISGNILTTTAGDLVFRIVRESAEADVSRVLAGATLIVTPITAS